MTKRRRTSARDEDGNFYVYVVRLVPHEGSHKPEVYVGSSALTPRDRFDKHVHIRKGGSRHVRRRGIALVPELYAHLNPLRSREAAKAAEQRLRRDLERRGFVVYGSCSPRETRECWL
jgi:hypothetical protein